MNNEQRVHLSICARPAATQKTFLDPELGNGFLSVIKSVRNKAPCAFLLNIKAKQFLS